MTPHETTMLLPPLGREASVQSIDTDQRSVELTFSSGGRVDRYDWLRGERYVEVLSLKPDHVRLDRLNASAPLLDSHGSYSIRSVLGSVIEGSARVENAKDARVTVRFSRRDDVEPIWRDVQDGVLKQVSVGYRVHKFVEERPASGPVVRTAVDWEPFEVSLVPMAADVGAKVRSDDPSLYACVIERDSKETAMPEIPETPVTTETTEPSSSTRISIDTGAAGAEARATQAERERAAAIRALGKRHKIEESAIDAMITRGITAETAGREILNLLAIRCDQMAPSAAPSGSERVTFGDDVRDKWFRGAGNWLLLRSGQAGLVAKHEGVALKDIDAGEFRGLSLIELARECLTRAGVAVRGLSRMEIAGQAMAHRYQTTSDFAVLLENTMHKILRASYGLTPDTWSQFCGTGTVSDFRTHNWYRLGSLTSFDDLNEHGEFKNKAIPDAEKATYAATTKGNIIAITREIVVNDDLGAVTRFTEMLGRAGKLTIEKAVYSLLAQNTGLGPTQADSQPLFHSNRANVGTGSALAAAALDADRVVMAVQTEPGGNDYTDLRPSILLLPVGLGGQARVINQSQYDPDTVANKSQMKPNVVVGLFSTIVDTPRLSGTRRYLFADPSIAPVFLVSFLEGQREPVLETQDGWRTNGVEMRARLDFGVNVVDYRGAVTNAGV